MGMFDAPNRPLHFSDFRLACLGFASRLVGAMIELVHIDDR